MEIFAGRKSLLQSSILKADTFREGVDSQRIELDDDDIGCASFARAFVRLLSLLSSGRIVVELVEL